MVIFVYFFDTCPILLLGRKDIDMYGYLLVATIFFAIITISIAVPPVVEELTDGVEQSILRRNFTNMDIYGEQLARVIIDGETVLTDQSAEDKTDIDVFDGEMYEQIVPLARRQFIDKPVNILKPRVFDEPPALEYSEPKKPFDHIKIHKYGFGIFCDKAQEEKIVRAVAALAVAHKIRRNPAIVEALLNESRDANFNTDVANHRKLVRGIFARLAGEDLNNEKDDAITKSIGLIIVDNKGAFYANSLNALFDNVFAGYVPFELSTYHGYYVAKSSSISEALLTAKEFFPWIQKVSSSDALNSPDLFARSVRRSVKKSDQDSGQARSKDVPFEDEMKETMDSSTDKSAMLPAKGESIGNSPDESKDGVEAPEAFVENSDDDANEGEEFVDVVDEDYVSEESYGLASEEASPNRPAPRNVAKRKVYSSVSSASSGSSSDSAISNSPIVTVPVGGRDPYDTN